VYFLKTSIKREGFSSLLYVLLDRWGRSTTITTRVIRVSGEIVKENGETQKESVEIRKESVEIRKQSVEIPKETGKIVVEEESVDLLQGTPRSPSLWGFFTCSAPRQKYNYSPL
jgi:hypothetical protein